MSSLQKYKKLKYLGKGSYGAALLVCLKADPNRKFVIKEIVVGHLKAEERQAAKKEAEVLHQMTHSNITMYIESFMDDSKLYIVMEHADGGDLTSAIQRRAALGQKWPEHEAMFIFVQICLALKHVHERNILHRDLKSQNIFLTSKGIVKLGDFGIAKVLDASDDYAKTQIGTPYYLSPEICESRPYGRSSDVWSLGVVLFEILALELPFQAPSLPALVTKICIMEPNYERISNSFSPQLVDINKTMLNKNCDARPDVRELVKSEFMIKHISRLLSYTIRIGKGGAERAAGGDDAGGGTPEALDSPHDNVRRNIEEVERSIEIERKKQRELEMQSKETQAAAERQLRHKEERDALKKLMNDMSRRKDSFEGDVVVYAPKPAVILPSLGAQEGPVVPERDGADNNTPSAAHRPAPIAPRPAGSDLASGPNYGRADGEYRRAAQQPRDSTRDQRRDYGGDPRDDRDRARRSDATDEVYSGYSEGRAMYNQGRERSLAEIRDERMRREGELKKQSEDMRRQFQDNHMLAQDNRRRASGPSHAVVSHPSSQMNGHGADDGFMSAARREYFANRAAAQQIKAKVEAFERGEREPLSGAPNPAYAEDVDSNPSRRANFGGADREAHAVSDRDRAAQMRAQRERDREKEAAEHEQRIRQALAEQREERRRLEERRRQSNEMQQLSFNIPPTAEAKYNHDDRRGDKRQDGTEERVQKAIAFEINFDDDSNEKVNKPPLKSSNSSINRPQVAGDSPSGRQRKSWGAPVLPNQLRVSPIDDPPKKAAVLSPNVLAARNLSSSGTASEVPDEPDLVVGLGDSMSEASTPNRLRSDRPAAEKVRSIRDLYETKEIEDDGDSIKKPIEDRKKNVENDPRERAKEVFRKLRDQQRQANPARGWRHPKSKGAPPRAPPRAHIGTASPQAAIDAKGNDALVQIPLSPSGQVVAVREDICEDSDALYEISTDDDADLGSTLDRFLEQQESRQALLDAPSVADDISAQSATYITVRTQNRGAAVGEVGLHISGGEADQEVVDLQCELAGFLLGDDSREETARL